MGGGEETASEGQQAAGYSSADEVGELRDPASKKSSDNPASRLPAAAPIAMSGTAPLPRGTIGGRWIAHRRCDECERAFGRGSRLSDRPAREGAFPRFPQQPDRVVVIVRSQAKDPLRVDYAAPTLMS